MEGMGYNLDPNLLVNALGRDNDNGGFGGNNGLLWIFMLVLFGWGGNLGGFGGRGAAGVGTEVGLIDAAINKAQAQGCSNELILTAISGNKEAINMLAASTGANFNQVDNAIRAVQNGICELGYKMGQDTASIISNITGGNAAISRQLADCCCATQRGIDSIKYDMQTVFCALNTNLDKCCCNMERFVEAKIDAAQMENRAGFQSIRDYLVGEKISSLQTDLQSVQFQLSQNAQTAAIENYIKGLLTVSCPTA